MARRSKGSKKPTNKSTVVPEEDLHKAESHKVGAADIHLNLHGDKEVKKKVHAVNNEFEKLAETIKEGVHEGMMDVLKDVTKFVAGFFSVKKAIGSTFETVVELNAEITKLGAVFGGVEQGEHALKFIMHLSTELPVTKAAVTDTVTALKALNFQLGEIEGLNEHIKNLSYYSVATGTSMKDLVRDVTDLVQTLDYGKAFDIAQQLAVQGALRAGENVQTVAQEIIQSLKHVRVEAGKPIVGHKATFEAVLRTLDKYALRYKEVAEYSFEGAKNVVLNTLDAMKEAIIGDLRDPHSPIRMLVDTFRWLGEKIRDQEHPLHHFFAGLGKVFSVLVHAIKPLVAAAIPFFIVVSKVVYWIGNLIEYLDKLGVLEPILYALGFGFLFLKTQALVLQLALTPFGSVVGKMVSWAGTIVSMLFRMAAGSTTAALEFSTGMAMMQRNTAHALTKLSEHLKSKGEAIKKGFLQWLGYQPKAAGPSKVGASAVAEALPKGKAPVTTSATKGAGTSAVQESVRTMSDPNLHKNIIAGGTALVAFAGSLFIFAKALQELSKVDYTVLPMAVLSIGMLGGALYGFMAIMTSFSVALPFLYAGIVALVAIAGSILAMSYAFKLFGEALVSIGTVDFIRVASGLMLVGSSLSSLLVLLSNPFAATGFGLLTLNLFAFASALDRIAVSTERIKELPNILERVAQVDIGKVTDKLATLSSINLGNVQSEIAVQPAGASTVVYNLNVSGYIQSLQDLKKELDRLNNKTKFR